MEALRDHFSGEGSATRRIAVAKALEDSLHYKNERSMTFEGFLTRCQKIFMIYHDEGEPKDEKAKIRFLFKAVAGSGLNAAVEVLKARIVTSVTAVEYSTIANYLATEVSGLPDNTSKRRNISGVDTDGETRSTIYNQDGLIFTGQISGWYKLSDEDRKIVTDERSRL